ncbi:hypothetical protein GCM10025865_02770 [Paraoerskovia sediminicola]|uniref:Amidase domain-containing protein n=1 Tax=Paraoerskovia sediminicola TaxID=1138587 RepID=A0ABN6X837_9CELL|nr:hypothetical protein GCM10025865_02770 [Paraoerskovia sediminicola]
MLTDPVIVADAPVHAVCLDAVAEAVAALTGFGHELSQAPVPFPAERWDAFESLWAAGALSAPVPEEAEPLLVPLTRWLRAKGRHASGLDVVRATGAVQSLTREVAVAWDDLDVVVSPTLAQPPAPIGSIRDDEDPAADFRAQMAYTPWTSVANLTGRPSISLPLGWPEIDGRVVPVGVMLTGRLGAETTLLSVAAALERALPWAHRRPEVGA